MSLSPGDRRRHPITIAVVIFLLGWFALVTAPCRLALAQEDGGVIDPAATAHEETPAPTILPGITVTDSRERPEDSTTTLSREEIERLPHHNSSIQELLRVLPGVQLSEKANLSAQGGELSPPPLSLAGGKVDQNTFLLDGMSLDSRLDPLANNPSDLDDVPGNPLTLSVNPDLIDSLELLDYDVPARVGKFSGGAVVVKTRDPGEIFSGKARLRTTRSNWTEFHLDPAEREKFTSSPDYFRQPRFERFEADFMLDVPLTPDHGLILDHQRETSRLPLRYFGETKNQHRQQQQTFLKWRSPLAGNSSLALSYLHAPWQGSYFIKNALHSDFVIRSGGDNLRLEYLRERDDATLEIAAGRQRSSNNRSAPDEWRNWKTSSQKNWGTLIDSALSSEGGSGDLDREQENLSLSAHLTFADRTGTGHRPALGLELGRTSAFHERKDTTYIYNIATQDSTVTCGSDTTTCVPNDQYFSTRNVYQGYRADARSHSLSLYSQGVLAYRRLSLQPGVRFDYDSLSDNRNVAPRLSLHWAPEGKQRPLLFLGVNRYYGADTLTHALRAGRPPSIIEKRTLQGTTPGAWSYSSQLYGFRRTKLATPYSDEVVFGGKSSMLGGMSELVALHRQNRDELARELGPSQPDGQRYFTFNNRGRSNYRSYRWGWKGNWARQRLAIDVSWQESKSNTEGYTTTLDDAIVARPIWYKGRLLELGEIPRNDFNRSWSGKLVYSVSLPLGVEFDNVTTYRGRLHDIRDTLEDYPLPSGENARLFEDKVISPSWVFDWTLRWNLPVTNRQTMTLTVDIFNVFNQRAEVATDFDYARYATGRQFWAGLEYAF